MTDVRDAVRPTDALDATIAQRIRDLRDALQISAAELDRIAKFGVGTIGRMERREQRVYAAHLYRIDFETGVGINYFYGTEPETSATTSAEERETQRLLNAYLHIKDPGMKRNVYELIQSMADELEATPNP